MGYNFDFTPEEKKVVDDRAGEWGQAVLPVPEDTAWYGSLLRPLLITLLVGCIAVAAVGFLRHIAPALAGYYVQITLVAALVSTFIGSYTTTLLVQSEQRHRRTLAFRAAEVGLILFLLRVAVWLLADGMPTLQAVLYSPLSTFFSGPFVVAGMLVYGTWILSVLVTDDFLEMGLRSDELGVRTGWGEGRWSPDVHVRSDRQGLLTRFTQRWIGGGVLMLLLTAGSQIGAGSNGFFAIARQAIDPLVIGASVVYFLIGLILIAVGRLAVLRAQWQIERIPAETTIARNWPVYTIALLLITGLVAAVLPLGGTFRLAQILGWIIQTLYVVVFGLLALIMAFVSQFLPQGEGVESAPSLGPISPQQVEAGPSAVAVPPWIGGTIFWIILALLLGYAAYVYLQERGVSFAWLRLLWERLRQAWLGLWGEFESWRAGIEPIAQGNDGQTPGLRVPQWWKRLQLGRMSATERIRYFYLTTLEKAQEEGIGRKPGETPLRYAPRLEDTIHEEGDKPFAQLTAEFVEIQYAGQTLDDDSASYAQRLWERIQRALEKLRTQKDENSQDKV